MLTFPLWLIFSILTGLTSNAFNFMSRYILRGKDDTTVFAWYIEVGKIVIFLPVALIFDWKLVINFQSISILILTGLIEVLAIYCYMKMHSYSHLSISAIISRTRMIWVPVIAFFLIGEQLRNVDYIGIIILFIGVSLVSAPHKLFIDKGAMYANAAALLIAIDVVLAKMLIPYASISVMTAAHAIPAFFLLPLIMKNFRKRIRTSFTKNLKLKTLAVVLNILSFYFFLAAIQSGEVSKVNAIYQGMLFLSVLAGIVLLKEHEDILRKIIGTIVTVCGVILLSLN